MPRSILKYCSFLACLLCSFLSAQGQLQVWRHMNTEGMWNRNIMCMTEGASGLIYLGTQDGVEVFDGRRFMKIEIPGGAERGINPFVNALQWGRGGILWVATRTHVYTYNPANGAVRVLYGRPALININTFELDTLHQLLYLQELSRLTTFSITDSGLGDSVHYNSSSIGEMAVSADGSLYAVVDETKVGRIEGTTFRQLFEAGYVGQIAYMPLHNALLMHTDTGLVKLDLKRGIADTIRLNRRWKPRHAKTRLTVLTGDEVLVHDENGIYLFTSLTDTGMIAYSHDERNPASLRADFVIYAYSDKRKNIWVSEDGMNLSVLPANSRGVNYISPQMTGANRLWLSYHDTAHSQVLLSSERGLGVFRYKDTPIFQSGIKPDTLKFFEVLGYLPWEKNEILLITNGQGSWRFNTVTFSFAPFAPINKRLHRYGTYGAFALNDNDNIIYGPKGLYRFKRREGAVTSLYNEQAPDPGRPAGKVSYMSSYVDDKKNVWLGTGYGIDVFDSGMRYIKGYGTRKGWAMDGLLNTVTLGINRAMNGDTYVATMGGGVFRLTRADTFVSVPIAGGASIVYSVGVVDNEHMLFTTSKGMCLYNTADGSSRVIDGRYGLPIEDYNQFALGIDNKFVMASGATGIAIIDHGALKGCFYDTARLLIMKGPRIITRFTLEEGNQMLDFDVAIPGYAAGANWRIRYKLEGLDDEWRELAGGAWNIRYNSITPGAYKLLVEAADAQHVFWSEPAVVSITALPYFWQTVWFRLLMLATALGVLVFTVRFFSQLQLKWKLKKLEDEQKVARERIRISRELHDNVGSQLTYLISGLESSDMLLERQDTQSLKTKIGKMQSSARESMQQLRDSIWALNLESVPVSVMLSRFNSWLQHIMEALPETVYAVSSEVESDHTLDPVKSLNLFRMMQEAVHNVMKHAHASELRVSFKSVPGRLVIEIADNGKGFDEHNKKGNGRKSLEARADEVGALLTVASEPGNGTRVKIELAIS